MRPIDTKICTTLEAHIYETKLMEERQATMNCCKAYVDPNYYEDYCKEYYKEYRKQNKDKINARMQKYREQNKDKLNARIREIREQNKDKINAYKRERYALKKLQKEEENNVVTTEATLLRLVSH